MGDEICFTYVSILAAFHSSYLIYLTQTLIFYNFVWNRLNFLDMNLRTINHTQILNIRNVFFIMLFRTKLYLTLLIIFELLPNLKNYKLMYRVCIHKPMWSCGSINLTSLDKTLRFSYQVVSNSK